jgi:hypothetical protein
MRARIVAEKAYTDALKPLCGPAFEYFVVQELREAHERIAKRAQEQGERRAMRTLATQLGSLQLKEVKA